VNLAKYLIVYYGPPAVEEQIGTEVERPPVIGRCGTGIAGSSCSRISQRTASSECPSPATAGPIRRPDRYRHAPDIPDDERASQPHGVPDGRDRCFRIMPMSKPWRG
jgi:hypothetical protein